ncbi:MAG: hypothetical protein ACOCQR_02745 [bacterium]
MTMDQYGFLENRKQELIFMFKIIQHPRILVEDANEKTIEETFISFSFWLWTSQGLMALLYGWISKWINNILNYLFLSVGIFLFSVIAVNILAITIGWIFDKLGKNIGIKISFKNVYAQFLTAFFNSILIIINFLALSTLFLRGDSLELIAYIGWYIVFALCAWQFGFVFYSIHTFNYIHPERAQKVLIIGAICSFLVVFFIFIFIIVPFGLPIFEVFFTNPI